MKRTIKEYKALADSGRDFVNFVFESGHRANSKANIEDAKSEYKRLHGHSIKIIKTWRL